QLGLFFSPPGFQPPLKRDGRKSKVNDGENCTHIAREPPLRRRGPKPVPDNHCVRILNRQENAKEKVIMMESSTPKTRFSGSNQPRKELFEPGRGRRRRSQPRRCPWPLLAVACGLAFSHAAKAATASFTNNAPALGPND